MRSNSGDIDFDLDDIVDSTIGEAVSLTTNSELDSLYAGEIYQKIQPAKWEELISVLDFLSKDSDDLIVIRDSIITHKFKGSATMKADLNRIFGEDKLNLQISSPKKWVKLFKSFKKTSDIYIVDNENQFIITDGTIKLFLPKCLDDVLSDCTFPNMDDVVTVEKCIISKETRDTVVKLMGSQPFIEYLFQDNKMKAINIPQTAMFILPEYIGDTKAKKLNADNADLSLRTSVFLPYSSDTYTLVIGKRNNDMYCSHSLYRSALTTIEIYETLDNATGIDALY